jgi:hypothetical protein
MIIEISPKGTGACPLCKKNNNCVIQDSLKNELNNRFSKKKDGKFEMVIYACPEYKE